jgi:uncharacterized protein YbcI
MLAVEPPLSGEKLLTAVTEAMVALHQRHYHRTPVSAKTLMLGEDLLACVLGGIYTEVEQTMIELERSAIVQETRSAFQTAMQRRFVDEVQRLSGRGVLTFISNSHVGPDIEIELFMLAPLKRSRVDRQTATISSAMDSGPVEDEHSENVWPLDTVSAAMLAVRTIDDIDQSSDEQRAALLADLLCAARGSPWGQNQ